MSTYQNILLKGKLEAKLEEEKNRKASAKRLWLKGFNLVFIVETLEIPMEVTAEWLLEFEKE